MTATECPSPRRVLVIDDNATIHEDFRKILTPSNGANSLRATANLLFGSEPVQCRSAQFELAFALSGQEGLELIQQALVEGHPFMMAFVDVRMPTGWDGIETIGRLWNVCPELQAVICTAYADYSWDEITDRLGQTDGLVILKKPFDNVEVIQLAHTLTEKWILTRQAAFHRAHLDELVNCRTVELRAANAKLQEEIDERTRSQQALQRSEERFLKAFQASPIALAIQTVRDQTYVDVNSAFLHMLGCQMDEVLGSCPAKLGLWVEPGMWEQMLQLIARGGTVRNVACGVRRRDGVIRSTLVSLESFTLAAEPSLLVITQDISEQRTLEDQLRQAQKMEAIGQLAAGVAHDFNNVLTVIQGHATLRLRDAELPQRTQKALEQISLAASRGAGITKQLLAFSRKQVMEPKALRLSRVLEGLRGMLERLAGKQVELVIDCPEGLPIVWADEGCLGQVMMNLIANARDSMPGGGRIELTVRKVVIEDLLAETSTEARPGEFLCLAVADSGCGMDAALMRRVFEPFFTTKGVGKGTGLGLSMVYGIVKQHRGWVDVRSEVGKGSEFRVFLPSGEDPSLVSGHTTRLIGRASGPCGRETILLVEDDAAVRVLTAAVLREQGYTVSEAAEGKEALQTVCREDTLIDLLIFDPSTMDERDSQALASNLRSSNPRLRIIRTSGGSSHESKHQEPLREGVNLLQKPYDPGRLLMTVRRCLDQTVVIDGATVPSPEPAAAPA